MTALAPPAGCRRPWRTPAVLLLCLGAVFTSCQPDEKTDARHAEQLKADLEEAKRRLSHIHKTADAKEEELIRIKAALETVKNELAEKDQALFERDKQLRAAQAEIEAFKKSDAFVFAEIRALQRQGQSAVALTRYRKFMIDFPKSPLVGSAASAITEMSVAAIRETPRPPAETPDPARRDRELLKNFNEGYMTLQDLAPILKKKSMAQVVALLGKPNQSFNERTEIGYTDKAINPATGTRGMLIISFEAGIVSTLRVEYGGRKVTP